MFVPPCHLESPNRSFHGILTVVQLEDAVMAYGIHFLFSIMSSPHMICVAYLCPSCRSHLNVASVCHAFYTGSMFISLSLH